MAEAPSRPARVPDVAPEAVDLRDVVIADRYRILHLIGEGGMGRVYAAEHVKFGQQVALKLLHEELARDQASVRRFVREATAAVTIRHEHVVETTDFGRTSQGQLFLVMEMLKGEDLDTMMKREGRLSWPRAQKIVLQVVRGLGAAHRRGVIHRDLKPANIFLHRDLLGNEGVKLLDFGIAKVLHQQDGLLTMCGMVLGTPRYMSPEQAAGGEVDPRSDLYSVGVLAYEMLTGRAPFEGENVTELIWRQIHDRIEPPRHCAPDADIPVIVEQMVMRALAKDREDRYPNTGGFEAAILAASLETTTVGDADDLDLDCESTLIWTPALGPPRLRGETIADTAPPSRSPRDSDPTVPPTDTAGAPCQGVPPTDPWVERARPPQAAKLGVVVVVVVVVLSLAVLIAAWLLVAALKDPLAPLAQRRSNLVARLAVATSVRMGYHSESIVPVDSPKLSTSPPSA